MLSSSMHNKSQVARNFFLNLRNPKLYCDWALIVWDSIWLFDMYFCKYRVTRKRSARFASALCVPRGRLLRLDYASNIDLYS